MMPQNDLFSYFKKVYNLFQFLFFLFSFLMMISPGNDQANGECERIAERSLLCRLGQRRDGIMKGDGKYGRWNHLQEASRKKKEKE